MNAVKKTIAGKRNDFNSTIVFFVVIYLKNTINEVLPENLTIIIK